MSVRRSSWVAAAHVAMMASLAWPAGTSAQTAASLPQIVAAGAVYLPYSAARTMDPLPHETRPDEWPQPDYFTEALKLTRFSSSANAKALKLASGVEPELLVLPVQTQVFGWAQDFNALVGARLDSQLAARGFGANRQTDVFDIEGPFVRRF